MAKLRLREWNSCACGQAASQWDSLTLWDSILALVDGGVPGEENRGDEDTPTRALDDEDNGMSREQACRGTSENTKPWGRGYGEFFGAHKRIGPGTGVWQSLEFKSYNKSVIFGGW